MSERGINWVQSSESRVSGSSRSSETARGHPTPPGGKPVLDMTDAEDLYRLHVRSGQATLASLIQVGCLILCSADNPCQCCDASPQLPSLE